MAKSSCLQRLTAEGLGFVVQDGFPLLASGFGVPQKFEVMLPSRSNAVTGLCCLAVSVKFYISHADSRVTLLKAPSDCGSGPRKQSWGSLGLSLCSEVRACSFPSSVPSCPGPGEGMLLALPRAQCWGWGAQGASWSCLWFALCHSSATFLSHKKLCCDIRH